MSPAKPVELILICVTGGEGEDARVNQAWAERILGSRHFHPGWYFVIRCFRGKNPEIHLRFSAADCTDHEQPYNRLSIISTSNIIYLLF
jgi:hypothetical protein